MSNVGYLCQNKLTSIIMSEKQLKIAIYANELNNTSESGVKVYTRELIKNLCDLDHKNKYYAYLRENSKDQASEVDKLGKDCGLVIRKSTSILPFWTYLKFAEEIKKDSPDVLFMPIQAVPFFRKPKDIRIVVTVHDLAYRLFRSHFTFKKRILLDFHTKRAVNMADRIIAPSITTKNDIIRHYGIDPKRIVVIYHGTIRLAGIEAPVSENAVTEIKSYMPYILFVGSIQPRKNIASLISAFDKIKAESANGLKLVICGPKGWMWEETFEAARKSAFSTDIIFTGNVSGDHLVCLYKNAKVFVMPSLYEGFGLPVVEAMEQGLPCAISNNSSLAEIGGGAVLLFDPYDISDIAKKIKLFLDDEKVRREYSKKSLERAKFFSWEKAAKSHVDVFEGM